MTWFSKSCLSGMLIVCILSGCGGSDYGSSDSTPATATTTISGKAEAPNGVIARFESSKPILLATMDFVFPAAGAAITGLQPVTGATVELIRIDNDGNQIGGVLASTVTSITGTYSLSLPAGVSLAGDLVVRISGAGVSMSAMVVDQTVNINPVSQFVLNKFIDVPNLVLGDLAINEVVSLSGRVEDFDLTAGADLATMLAQLEAEVGAFVDLEIAVIEAPPDDGTASAAVAGNWHSVEFELGLEDQDEGLSGSLAVRLNASAGTPIEDAGAGNINIGEGLILIDAFTDYAIIAPGTRVFGYGIESNVAGDPEFFPATIDAGRNISIAIPFEESLDDGGPEGPEFGERSPPRWLLVKPVANGNTYISPDRDAAVGYGTIDTNNDGVLDALNPQDRQADLVEASLGILLKQGSGMNVASLNGDFGTVSLSTFFDLSPQGVLRGTVGQINFTDGTVTIEDGARDTRQVIRQPVTLTSITLTDSLVPEGAETLPYTVSGTGQVTLDNDSSIVGLTNDDGSVIALVGGEALGNPVSAVSNGFGVYVRLGTDMASSLNDASYQLYTLVYVMRDDGYTSVGTFNHGAVGVFDSMATTFTVNGDERIFFRNTDLSQVGSFIDPTDDLVFTVDSAAANGAVSMNFGTDELTLDGFVSADGNLLIMRALGTDTGERLVGMAIGVRQ